MHHIGALVNNQKYRGADYVYITLNLLIIRLIND